MSLAEYHRKRDFHKTQEPKGREQKVRGRAFVIQKHHARRLHYDFRLEMEGVLKSWAVPKGPSEDPADKRLAVEVEDHPLDYGSFEGTIPKGQYGAGKVEIWDTGNWEPKGDPLAGLHKGHLNFSLNGRRLHGDWALVRMKGREENGKKNWLLIKDKKAKPRTKALSLPKKSVRLPENFHPQLATLVDQVPLGDDWLHEMKFDGYRLLCFLQEGKVTLMTRNGLDWTSKFPLIAREAAKIPINNAILDGEVVVQGPKGVTDFQKLQNFLKKQNNAKLQYYLFDLPYLEGQDLSSTPLIERKKALQRLFSEFTSPHLRYSEHIQGRGKDVYANACRLGTEGIISKHAQSPYVQARSRDWVKVKCKKSQEFVIGGYTDPQGGRKHFGSLLLGYHNGNGKLKYAGHVGTGFDSESLNVIWKELKKREQKSSPFQTPIEDALRRTEHFVKPELVGNVEFNNWTDAGILRHPSFTGLREDKPAEEVSLEKPIPAEKAAEPISQREENGSEIVAGVKLSHAGRILYPEQGITKRELARYYEKVAKWMLPHIKGRPLSLVRCPRGSGQFCFYQKHLGDTQPEAVRSITIKEKDDQGDYAVVDDLKGLVSLAQIGVLEIHPWGAREKNIEIPDLMVFDLDPGPGVAWKYVVEGAFKIREKLNRLKLKSFVKTTGGKGLHVVVPFPHKLNWDDFKDFARTIAEQLAKEEPHRYTATVSKSKRSGKIFVDYLRNGRGSTSVAPFSTRARPGALVAFPLSWEELSKGIDPKDYHVRSVPGILSRRKKDPWQGFFSV